MADPIGSFSGLASGIQWRDMVDQIMAVERARRVQPLETQQSTQKSRSDAWASYQGLIGKLTNAAKTLQDGSAFGTFKVSGGQTAAGKALFGASAGEGAAPGSYRVEVKKLAQAEKLKSAVQASTTSALGLSGEVVVNGRAVTLAATDTLAGVRDKLNAVNAGSNPSGVTATLLTQGDGQHYLVLTSGATGKAGIELSDLGGALSTLGIASGQWSDNATAAGGAQTARLGSKTTSLASMLGLKSPPTYREILIDGKPVTVDFETDTMESLLQKIQQHDAQARLVEEPAGGRTTYRLELSGAKQAAAMDATVTPELTPEQLADSQRTLRLLGFQQSENGAGAQIAAGQDAEVEVDGILLTRPGNTISGALQGITLNLQASAPGETVTLTVERDVDAMVSAVKGLASAYNEVRAFQQKQNTPGSPLFANGTLRSTVAQLTSVLLADLKGLPSGSLYDRGALVGVSLSKTGTLEVDETALRAALDGNLADVKALFGGGGSVSGDGLEYVAAGGKTQPGSYSVEITQVATRGASTGSAFAAAYGGGPVAPEKLTIADGASGNALVYTVPAGKGLDDVVAELNAQFATQKLKLTASALDGALHIEGSGYGSAARFTLSDGETAADGTVTGAGGLARLGLSAGTSAGQDVKGYLYTDAAEKGDELTGGGRTLTGASGTAAEGLQVQYTGSSANTTGMLKVSFALGLAGALAQQSDRIGRSGDGTVALQMESLSTVQTRLTTRIDDAEAILERRREAMVKQFSKMEEAMSRLQAQGSWLTQQIQTMRPRTD